MKKPARRLVFALLGVVLLALAVPAITAGASSPKTGAAEHQTLHQTLLGKSSPATRHKMGNFTHPKPPTFEHDQFGTAKLPIGHFHARRHSLQTNAVGIGNATRGPRLASRDPKIDLNTAHAATYDGQIPAEPTAAAVGNKVVYTSNDLLSLSVDGGHTFHSFNPRSMYRDSPAGGSDGDQDVIYVPQINRFVWIVQYFPGKTGANLDRLAVFPPSSVTKSGLSSWTTWDISQSSLPGTNPFFDFPDLAFGDNFLYLTQNSGAGGKVNQTFMVRIGLSNLKHGLNLAAAPEPWRYFTGTLFFGKVVQNTGNVAYWASNSSTSTMAASDWPESSTTWSGPTNVNVASWPNKNYASKTPDGKNWLKLYTGVVEGSARVGNHLYFAWTAGRGSGQLSWLTQPHVELAEMTTSFTFVSQRALWNAKYVYAWPYLTSAPNRQGNPQLGISLVAGGGNLYYPSAEVGDLTTSPNFVDTDVTSNANCGCGRWGDYLAVRPDYGASGKAPGAQFVATGFGYDVPVTSLYGGYDDHYVTFTG